MSGTTPSWSQAKVLPVRPRPDWISSATNSTLCAGAELADAAQVAVGRDDHAALALDRLDQHGDGVLVDGRLEGRQVAVRDDDEAGRERAEAVARVRVVGEADDGGGAAVEVAGGDDDLGLVGGDALDLVAPLAGDLDRGLDGLGAGVHRQHEVLAAQVAERGAEVGELVVDERAAGQRQPVELGVRGGDQRGVAVAEVERRVAGQQVEVATCRRRRSSRRPRRARSPPAAGGSCARCAPRPARTRSAPSWPRWSAAAAGSPSWCRLLRREDCQTILVRRQRSRTAIVVPPGALSSVTVPSCERTIASTRESPSPAPPR